MNPRVAVFAVIIALVLAGLVVAGFWLSRGPDKSDGGAPAQTAGSAAEADDAADEDPPVPLLDPEPDAPGVPTFDIVRVEPDGMAVLAGRADPGATVTLYDNGEPIESAGANDRGEWTMILETPLAPGQHKLALEARIGDGPATPSEQVVVVDVPERAERTPLVVLTDPDGPSQVLQAPGDGVADGTLVFESVDYDENGNVIFSGRAEPGADLQAYVDNELYGVMRAGEDGRWTLKPKRTITVGTHELRIDQVDEDGKVLARVAVPFERAPPDALQLTETGRVVVQPGNSLWRISHRLYGAGIRYVQIYEANQDQIRDPDLIYPGQVFDVPGVTESEAEGSTPD